VTIPVAFLVVSLIGAWFTFNAYNPMLKHRRRSVISFFAGWLTVELALHHIAWQVLATCVFIHLGALAEWPGRLGLAISIASWAALALLYRRATQAEEVVEQIYPTVPELEYRTMEADDMSDLVSRLPARSLLVFGAPGGGWIRRHVSGPGAQLRSKASVGVVMVRSAPRRVFQVMEEPVFVAPMMHARDTLRIRSESTLAVAEGGRLVGLVRRSRLSELEPDTPVGQAMEEPVSISHTAAVAEAAPLLPLFGEDPVPVVDDAGRLVGSLIVPPS